MGNTPPAPPVPFNRGEGEERDRESIHSTGGGGRVNPLHRGESKHKQMTTAKVFVTNQHKNGTTFCKKKENKNKTTKKGRRGGGGDINKIGGGLLPLPPPPPPTAKVFATTVGTNQNKNITTFCKKKREQGES